MPCHAMGAYMPLECTRGTAPEAYRLALQWANQVICLSLLDDKHTDAGRLAYAGWDTACWTAQRK